MRKQLEKYVKTELKTLKYKGDSIKLKNVYPSLLENILDNFTHYQINGYDCDYWVDTDKYEISGCMRFGTAEITLKVGKEKIIETKIEPKKEEPKKSMILRTENVSKDILSQLQTFYFTFGYGQKHEGYFQPIMAINSSIANKKMYEIYGTKWSFMYDKETWKDAEKYFLGNELETIVAL